MAECGCKIVTMDTPPAGAKWRHRIEYCPLHAAAEKMRDALEPFAAFCENFDGKQLGLAREDEDPIYTFNFVSITLGMVRQAKKVLAAARGEKP